VQLADKLLSTATGEDAGAPAPVAALDEVASKRLLAHYGIPVPASVVLDSADGIADKLSALSPPLAVKVIAPGVLHKSDVGGVVLNLPDAAAVRNAMRDMRASSALAQHGITGFLVETMAPRGHEIVVGGTIDASFGPVVMIGLGGIFVEVFADVAFRVCPITRRDAHDMIASLKAAPLLAGARGGIVAAMEPLVDVLLRVGGEGGLLVREAHRLREIDINPLIVSSHGAIAVDARVILA